MSIQTGQQATAQDMIKSPHLYAADAGASDAYAISLPVAPSAYTDGLTVRFKANTANTGACTLNVNSLGAIAIKRPDTTDTRTGDIVANQMVEVVYRGGSFYMISPVNPVSKKNGTATYDMSVASAIQTIAHGLGKVPSNVKITVSGICQNTGGVYLSTTVYNGTTQSSFYIGATNTGGVAGLSFIAYVDGGGAYQSGVVTFDATNIYIAWTKTGNPVSTANLLWEAE